MKLETLAASDLSTEECNKLRSLTMRKQGQLRDMLTDWRWDDRARVVRMTDDNGRIIAWGMHTNYDPRGNRDVMLYVRKSERRKGYGKAVYSRLINSVGGRASAVVHPHSVASITFFNSVHYAPQHLPLVQIPKEFIKTKEKN